jgi:hypothetical protein
MRALASAIILLTATCFGQGVGPLAVGIINDALKNDYGANAALFAAVGRGHDHARRAIVRMGDGVHSRRHQAGDDRALQVGGPVYFFSPSALARPQAVLVERRRPQVCKKPFGNDDETILGNPRNRPETNRG